MKRPLIPLLAAITAASLVIAGCGQAAPAPTPTKAAAAPTKAVEPAKPAAATAAPTKAAEPTKAPAPPTAAPAKKVDWPQKGRAITLVNPFSAGGAVDISARIMAPALEKELGTPVQVVNKVGGSSVVGATEVVTSRPDGYTVLWAGLPTINAAYLDPDIKASYNRLSFAPVARATADAVVISVRADSPYKTLKDLVDAAKANPEKIKVGTSGIMSSVHIPLLQLEQAAGVKFATVHYDGSRPALTALLGGHVDVCSGMLTEARENWKAGDVRVLALYAPEPSEFMSGVPTATSQGYKIDTMVSHIAAMPAGTPREIVDVLDNAIKKVLDQNDVKDRLTSAGMMRSYLNSADVTKLWDQQDQDIKPLMALKPKK